MLPRQHVAHGAAAFHGQDDVQSAHDGVDAVADGVGVEVGAAHDVVDAHVVHDGPLGCRWDVTFSKQHTPTHVLRYYRDQLDQMREDQMIWEPYTAEVLGRLPDYCLTGQYIWRTRAPLICFDVVEWHFSDRVTRQFGLIQRIPQPCDTSRALHAVNRRGRSGRDWTVVHQVYTEMWAHRRDTIVTGDLGTAAMDLTDAYMQWYRRITRRLIGPPIARPTVGFQPVGSILELLEETLTRIYHTAHATYEGSPDLALCMDTIGRITNMSSSCLTSIREQRRLVDASVSATDVLSTFTQPPHRASDWTTPLASPSSSTFVLSSVGCPSPPFPTLAPTSALAPTPVIAPAPATMLTPTAAPTHVPAPAPAQTLTASPALNPTLDPTLTLTAAPAPTSILTSTPTPTPTSTRTPTSTSTPTPTALASTLTLAPTTTPTGVGSTLKLSPVILGV